jgi:competence protein ComEA
VKAEEIINYRTNIDKFQKIDDILNVKGIGPKTFESIKQNISIG